MYVQTLKAHFPSRECRAESFHFGRCRCLFCSTGLSSATASLVLKSEVSVVYLCL